MKNEQSKIEWTDFTFNPWIGCTKISAACDNCYAETQNDFRKWNSSGWGAHAPRRKTSPANWRKPLKWNKQAAALGVRYRVFCASLADVFDNHKSISPEWREELWALIKATPNLDWLLLTKRPQNIARFLPADLQGAANIWLGATVENQEQAELRIPILLQTNAAVRFLSCEPLLGAIDLEQVEIGDNGANALSAARIGKTADGDMGYIRVLHWVIVGGESGSNARPMHPDWAISLRDQCERYGVPFLFKQWGEWGFGLFERKTANVVLNDGAIFETEDFKPQYEKFKHMKPRYMTRVGKKRAGRLLDGVLHDGTPQMGANK